MRENLNDPDPSPSLETDVSRVSGLPEQIHIATTTGPQDSDPTVSQANRNNSDFAPHEQNEAPIALGLPVSEVDLAVPNAPEDDFLGSQRDRGRVIGPSIVLVNTSSPQTTTAPLPASSRNVSFATAGVNPVSESHAGQSLWSKNWRIASRMDPSTSVTRQTHHRTFRK
ncbi:hypothetical protein QFC20_002976 [Naganishia adeliensis]|uniref:Uncharacterized protein n=1 Tax=Naganishia adeliensis TaxID=92952 RepID=A0ACC2WF44_9TREE|nr:hypothetical protein QFC20_002976 [Naganishia adeliensis]